MNTDFDILVNKEHLLSPFYTPDNLVEVPATHNFMKVEKIVKPAYDEFLAFQEEAKLSCNGLDIYICSGFRTYATQGIILTRSVVNEGISSTVKRVALPGQSEHQTGLAMDLMTIKNELPVVLEEEESKKLRNISSEYGFILRYPEGKEKITGYQYEPWHFRYVGKDLATYLSDNSWTLEEYYYYDKPEYRKKIKIK